MKFSTAIILNSVNVEPFELYCIRCKRYMCTINRDILMIGMGVEYPMQVPRNMGWVKQTCHACKTTYNFYFN